MPDPHSPTVLAHLDIASTRATKRNHHLQAALPVTAEQTLSKLCAHLLSHIHMQLSACAL